MYLKGSVECQRDEVVVVKSTEPEFTRYLVVSGDGRTALTVCFGQHV